VVLDALGRAMIIGVVLWLVCGVVMSAE
jgi:hypothetical protein